MKSRFALIVKGCERAATAACEEHGCTVTTCKFSNGSCSLIGEAEIDVLAEWFSRDTGRVVFEPGALLYYRRIP